MPRIFLLAVLHGVIGGTGAASSIRSEIGGVGIPCVAFGTTVGIGIGNVCVHGRQNGRHTAGGISGHGFVSSAAGSQSEDQQTDQQRNAELFHRNLLNDCFKGSMSDMTETISKKSTNTR